MSSYFAAVGRVDVIAWTQTAGSKPRSSLSFARNWFGEGHSSPGRYFSLPVVCGHHGDYVIVTGNGGTAGSPDTSGS